MLWGPWAVTLTCRDPCGRRGVLWLYNLCVHSKARGNTQKHTHLYSICLNIHTVVAAAKRHVHNGRKAENQGAPSEQWVKMPPVDIQYHVQGETVKQWYASITVSHSPKKLSLGYETQTKATHIYHNCRYIFRQKSNLLSEEMHLLIMHYFY